MPTVLRWARDRAFFYSNEGDEPPHLHVRSGNREVKIWLHNMGVAVNYRFPQHELGDIIRYLETHRDTILEAWHDHFGD